MAVELGSQSGISGFVGSPRHCPDMILFHMTGETMENDQKGELLCSGVTIPLCSVRRIPAGYTNTIRTALYGHAGRNRLPVFIVRKIQLAVDTDPVVLKVKLPAAFVFFNFSSAPVFRTGFYIFQVFRCIDIRKHVLQKRILHRIQRDNSRPAFVQKRTKPVVMRRNMLLQDRQQGFPVQGTGQVHPSVRSDGINDLSLRCPAGHENP